MQLQEMIVRSHVTITLFPLVITFCNTTAQDHNQNIDIDKIKIQNISITTRIHHVALL